MAINYKEVSYFQTRPEVVKIFDDLEAYHNFCRMEMLDFNEAHLYNNKNDNWNKYLWATRQRKGRNDYAKKGKIRHQ